MEGFAHDRECAALQRLLRAAEAYSTDFTIDFDAVLGPLVAQTLPESDVLLSDLVKSLGWDGQRFTRPLECQAFIGRLKGLMYDGLEIKGRGAYATVYKARNRASGDIVTLKKLKLECTVEGVPAQAIREISLLRELEHPNIVSLLDVLWDEDRLFIILEHLDLDLRQHMDTGPLVSSNVRRYLFDILQGLEYAHARGVLHRDLKPQNILVDRARNACKLADFGLARSFVPPVRPLTHEVVTLVYRPPEILLGSAAYSTPADMWSVGCIFAELVTSQVLFLADTEVAQLFAIFKKLGTPSEATWPGVTGLPNWQPLFPKWTGLSLQRLCPGLCAVGLDLLGKMLAYDPTQRISASQAVQHPFFQGLQPYFSPPTPTLGYEGGSPPTAAGGPAAT